MREQRIDRGDGEVTERGAERRGRRERSSHLSLSLSPAGERWPGALRKAKRTEMKFGAERWRHLSATGWLNSSRKLVKLGIFD